MTLPFPIYIQTFKWNKKNKKTGAEISGLMNNFGKIEAKSDPLI
jgi:hypothetical protein